MKPIRQTPEPENKPTSTAYIPYINNTYGRLSRMLAKYNIKSVALPHRKIASYLPPVKDAVGLKTPEYKDSLRVRYCLHWTEWSVRWPTHKGAWKTHKAAPTRKISSGRAQLQLWPYHKTTRYQTTLRKNRLLRLPHQGGHWNRNASEEHEQGRLPNSQLRLEASSTHT